MSYRLRYSPVSLRSFVPDEKSLIADYADAIFGPDDGSELGPSMKTMSRYGELAGWSAADWAQLLQK